MQNIPHIPVLYNEVLDCFKDINKGYIIDCTTGYAGHSSGLLNQNSSVKLICNDQDDEALNFSKNRLKDFENRVEFNKGNFENIIKKFENYPFIFKINDVTYIKYLSNINTDGSLNIVGLNHKNSKNDFYLQNIIPSEVAPIFWTRRNPDNFM